MTDRKTPFTKSFLKRRVLEFISKPGGPRAQEEKFNRLALDIFSFQYERNRAYRMLCDLESKVPGTVRRWPDIPAMPAQAFKELALTTFPKNRAAQYFETSGTTDTKKGIHYFEDLSLYRAAIFPPFESAFCKRDKHSALYFLTASPAEKPHSSLSFMMGQINEKYAGGKAKYYVRRDRGYFSELARDLRNEKRPAILFSTALSLSAFLDYLKKLKPIRLARGSFVFETGGLKGKQISVSHKTLHKICRERLGVAEHHCVSEYGMTELSSQCYGRKIFQGPAWMRTRVIDPRTGQEASPGKIGLLRHFDLANLGSVMAVQTEDLGRARGRGFELLGRAPASEPRGCSLSYESIRI